jgi:hypothetical protein
VSKPLTSTGYSPDFDLDLRTGALGEHLVGTFWEELQRTGTVEVKVDRGAWRTGNHYVETAQSSDGVTVPAFRYQHDEGALVGRRITVRVRLHSDSH